MAFVQVKNLLQTWKLAAFTVAFFSSFFSYSAEIDFSKMTPVAPESQPISGAMCRYNSKDVGRVSFEGINVPANVFLQACQPLIEDELSNPIYNHTTCGQYSLVWTGDNSFKINYTFSTYGTNCASTAGVSTGYISYYDLIETAALKCPPSANPNYTYGLDQDNNGEPDSCYNPADIQNLIDNNNELDRNEDYCKGLLLDSGNNTSSNACYSAPNGAQCSVEKVTVSSGDTYYQGTDNEILGCGGSDKPPFDQQGIGDDRDDCVYSDGVNYCKANKEKHCSDTNGVTSCESGCIESGDIALCDASKHPDVGEGDSDYFNSNGTCSAISASSSKGFCEEMGGTWDDNAADFQETSCPVGSGSCSTGSSLCGACIDEGGVWTPDSNAQTDINAINDVSQRVKDSNVKLSAIENTTRKSGEAITSTIKSGNGKIVSAIDDLIKATKEKETEKETFTTTTGPIDKTGINSLFDSASTTQLQADIQQAKDDITTQINTVTAELKTLMTISVPTGSGYQARPLNLSYGTHDMSLNRYAVYFQALAGPIMFVCSVIAGFLLLGGSKE